MTVRIREVDIGGGAPLVLIAGLNVIEDEDASIQCAQEVKRIASRTGIPTIFKASFDKANRTSVTSHRGPGLDKGLEKLNAIKEKFNVPVVSDIHDAGQVEKAAQIREGSC